jgi:predicted O-methyltransferase YrrM
MDTKSDIYPPGHETSYDPAEFGNLPASVRELEERYQVQSCGYQFPDGSLSYGPVELEVGRLWYSLTMLARPRVVVETGTYAGYSASCIASALKLLGGSRRLYSIDPAPLKQIWSGSSVANFIEQIPLTSQEAVALIRDRLNGEAIDLLLLDSDHTYDTIHAEFVLYEPMVRRGGMILLHDTIYFDGVGHLVNQVKECNRFEVLTLESPSHHDPPTLRCPGITLIRKIEYGDSWPPFDEAARGLEVGDANAPSRIKR